MKKLFTIIIVVILFYLLTRTTMNPLSLFWKQKPVQVCTLYGNQPKDKILEQYIVQPGDSLLSIAEEKLGDATRIEELITFNKSQYPDLSLNAPYLTEGWKLYLPPKNAGKTAGDLKVVSGNVSTNTDTDLTIHFQKTDIKFHPDAHTEYKDIKPIDIGDCVTLAYNETTKKVYIIGLQ